MTGGRYESTDDAYIACRAGFHQRATSRAGCSELAIRDNQQVSKGDLLFRLDDRPFRIAVDEAQARATARRAKLESHQGARTGNGWPIAPAAQIDARLSSEELARQQGLLEPRHFFAGASREGAGGRVMPRREHLEAPREQIVAVLADSAAIRTSRSINHPTVQQAQAAGSREVESFLH